VFPARIGTPHHDQVFYFGPDGLLRRHDYDMGLACNIATADYTDDHQVFGGSAFPRCGGPSDANTAPPCQTRRS
jgi:hypothetical protein